MPDKPLYYDPETGGRTAAAFAACERSGDGAWQLARLERERDDALAAAEMWSRELHEARETTAKAVSEAETFQHARDLLHNEVEEARGKRNAALARISELETALAKAIGEVWLALHDEPNGMIIPDEIDNVTNIRSLRANLNEQIAARTNAVRERDEARALLEKREQQGANDHEENAQLRLELLEARTELRKAHEEQAQMATAWDLLRDNSCELRRDHDAAYIQWSIWHCGDRVGPRAETPFDAVLVMWPEAF